ncbi:MAG: TetR/AcrR family transcriptional regulator [Acidobacteriota bacterium]
MSFIARPSKTDVVTEFRRGQILDAARAEFARLGVGETTVDHIARAAGVAKGTVYLYYRSKDEILRQLLDHDLTELRDETLPSIQAPGDLETRLRRYLTAMLGFFERKRDFIDHCQLELSPEARKQIRATLFQLYGEQIAAWDVVLSEAEPGASQHPTGAAAANIVSLARGLALQRLARGSTEPIESSAAQATALLWKGLAAR